MGLSSLGKRNLNRIRRVTGLEVAWGSVNTSSHKNTSDEGQQFRFWTPEAIGTVRLGFFNSKTEEWRLTAVVKDVGL